MKIAFYAGSVIPIHAFTLEERPLGGTETGLIRVAEALQRKGHDVTVFTAHPSPPPSQPRYLPAQAIHQGERFDLLVLIQDWKPAVFPLPSSRIWLWTGDGPEQYSNYGIGDPRVFNRIEKLLTVSNYHADSLCAVSGFPREKAHIIWNGVYLPFFEGAENRTRKRLLFTSAPYRGLSLVPEMFIKILEKHPDAEFHSFSNMNLYDREKPYEGPHVDHFKKVIGVLQKVPRCFIHQTVPQRMLAREYMRSGIFFYPCTVPETCCLTALEAQAGGCALVTSSLGALRETVGDAGIVVDGAPGTVQFSSAFVEATHKLLSDDALWKRCARSGMERVQSSLSWDNIAERFELFAGQIAKG